MDMMYTLFIPIVLAVAFLSYNAGYAMARNPTEEAMFERLVRARMERKMEADTREQLQKEINEAGDRRGEAVPNA